jgi:urocanate hydratase
MAEEAIDMVEEAIDMVEEAIDAPEKSIAALGRASVMLEEVIARHSRDGIGKREPNE